MADAAAAFDLDTVLPDAPFSEVHRRIVDRPVEAVWPACLAVTVGEVRTLGPLMALRTLPGRLRRRGGDGLGVDTPLLDAFAAGGFVVLRRDEVPSDGRARLVLGAIGRFWSITGNQPIRLAGPEEFVAFDQPGYAVTGARLDAVDLGDGRTRIETETRVGGTDAAATRRFAPYWAVIRLPSGLIRRSWLAAIDRRAQRA